MSCCFAFVACSKSEEDIGEESRQNARHIEIAQSSFSAVTESYNGYVTIKGTGMTISATTTVQQVVDFLNSEGVIVTTDHLNTALPFLGGCQQQNGYYTFRTDIDWSDYYID